MVALSFDGLFRIWENLFKSICFKIFPNISLALLPSSRFNLHVHFRLFCQTTIIQKPLLIRKEKITKENCGTRTTRNNIVPGTQRLEVKTSNFFSFFINN